MPLCTHTNKIPSTNITNQTPNSTCSTSHPLQLIFSQNFRNLQTEALVGLSFPIPILHLHPLFSPSTSKQLNLRIRTLTLTLSSSHSTPKNRTSSGRGRDKILTSNDRRYISFCKLWLLLTKAGATFIVGKTCCLTRSFFEGRRSKRLRRRVVMSWRWSLRERSYCWARRWGEMIMCREMRSYKAGRRGRKEFMRSGQ